MDNPPVQPPIIFTPTPFVLPEPPKKKSFAWLLILVFLFLLASTGVLAYQYYQLKTQVASPAPSPFLVPSLTPTPSQDPTADWKTYTSTNLGFSFHYPPNSIIKTDTLSIDGSLEFNNFILFVEKTNDTLTNYVNKLKDTNGTALVTKNIGDIPTIEWVGAFKNAPTHYISFENKGYVYSFGITPLDDMTSFNPNNTNLLDQILSTFKFLDDTKPDPSPSASLELISTISTNDWKSASNNGVQFKIPAEASCNDNLTCSLVSWTSQYQGNTLYHNIRVEVKDYLGGSRREQFYQNTKPECHDIYQEAGFGSVKSLQIAIDGGWCQGGGGGIVTIIGNKLVIIHNLFYNPETKIIDRWDVRDTLISTLN